MGKPNNYGTLDSGIEGKIGVSQRRVLYADRMPCTKQTAVIFPVPAIGAGMNTRSKLDH